jgi:hypothetical protein
MLLSQALMAWRVDVFVFRRAHAASKEVNAFLAHIYGRQNKKYYTFL